MVGTWIDGKKLYQKTFVKTGGVNSETVYFHNEFQNFETVLKKDVYFIVDSKCRSEYVNGVSDQLSVLVSDEVYTLFKGNTVTEMYVTVLYTKTTD